MTHDWFGDFLLALIIGLLAIMAFFPRESENNSKEVSIDSFYYAYTEDIEQAPLLGPVCPCTVIAVDSVLDAKLFRITLSADVYTRSGLFYDTISFVIYSPLYVELSTVYQ